MKDSDSHVAGPGRCSRAPPSSTTGCRDRWSAYQHGLDRCNCGLHDLTDLEAQRTEVAVTVAGCASHAGNGSPDDRRTAAVHLPDRRRLRGRLAGRTHPARRHEEGCDICQRRPR